MGFGNGAFQAARIAIDGVTIIQNIVTGKIQAPGTAIPSATNSYLSIPITNNQNVATPAPFQQMIQLNLSQYPQLEGIASDLSNVYFSSDEAGQSKLYSWRETPASLTSDVIWWVLLPNGIPASGVLIIYLQVSSSTALDGVYTGEAPQLSSTYGQYDNGANVFTNYWNFAGTSLPSGWTSYATTSGGPTYSVNNGLIESGTSTNGSLEAIHVYTSSTYTPSILEAYVSNPINPYATGTAFKFGYATTSPASGGDSGTQDWYAYGFEDTVQEQTLYILEKVVSGSETILGSINNLLSEGVFSLYWPATGNEEGTFNYINYTISSTDSSLAHSPSYIDLKMENTQVYVNREVIYQWVRTRAYPPNGVMPALQTSIIKATAAIIASTPNTWTAPQTFSAGMVDVNPTYAYVANYSSGNVSVIDTATNTVVSTITVGTNPFDVAITPNGQYAYVVNVGSSNVSVINTSTNAVVATISVGTSPFDVAITPNGQYAYVVNVGSSNVSVINTATNTVVSTISVGTNPYSIAITPNGLYAYVANEGSGNVSVINTATNTVVDTISTGGYPVGIAITPNGRYAYVASTGSTSVLVIDTATNTVVSTITVGTNPFDVAITPNGQYAYVTNEGSKNVSVINTSTNTVVNTISVGSSPAGIAITPNGLYAYVVNSGNNNVSVIDTSTNTVVTTITVEGGPIGVAITPYFYTSTGIAPYLSGFQQNTATPQTTLTGSTAGSITYSMPTAEGAYKKFVAYASGYENDTTTAQTISFPVAFINTPYVVTAPSGLISSISTTGITLASGTTTTYTGWIIIEGY